MVFYGYLLLVNATAFYLFADDKRRSMDGSFRVRESRMLLVAALGGSLGAVCAQRIIRHKTRKQPFADMLLLTLGLQLGAVFGIGLLLLAIRST